MLAVSELVAGRWIVATVILVPLVGLLFRVQYAIRWSRCRIGDQIRVIMGPHEGKKGVIIDANKAGTSFTVRLSSADPPEPVDLSDCVVRKVKPAGL